MQSKAKTVAAYLKEVPTERKAALTKLRQHCRALLTGYVEGMDYGGPGYKRNGLVEVGFASQRNYISFYVLNESVMKANKHLLKGLSVGKGCIRYSKVEKMDFAVIDLLLTETVKSKEPPC